MAVVGVRGLRKHYGGRAVVDGVSFVVATGEIFGIVGPDGAGKTTTARSGRRWRWRDGGVWPQAFRLHTSHGHLSRTFALHRYCPFALSPAGLRFGGARYQPIG